MSVFSSARPANSAMIGEKGTPHLSWLRPGLVLYVSNLEGRLVIKQLTGDKKKKKINPLNKALTPQTKSDLASENRLMQNMKNKQHPASNAFFFANAACAPCNVQDLVVINAAFSTLTLE